MARKHRFLKLAVLAAAAGAALYWLSSREQEHEHTKGPEAGKDAAAEAPNTAPVCDTEPPVDTTPDPETPSAAPAEEEPAQPEPAEAVPAAAEPEAPAGEETQPAPKAPVYRPVRPEEGGPNVNPVEHHSPAPPVVDGKLDVTKIAAPEDFANWDDLGCQG